MKNNKKCAMVALKQTLKLVKTIFGNIAGGALLANALY